MPPALAILELSSIARGVIASDAIVKKAEVGLWQSRPVSSGKHILVFGGEVAECEEAFAAGRDMAGDALVDQLFLPFAHAQLPPLIQGGESAEPRSSINGSVAVVETSTVCSTVFAADAAAKAADVTLINLRLAVGIGGKAFFTMTGELYDVQASVEAARAVIAPATLVGTEIVPAPHDDLKKRLLF